MRRASQCGLDWIDTRAFVGFLNQSWANLHNCQTFMKLPESSLPGEEMARVRIKRGRSGGKRKKGEKKGEKGRSGGKGQEWGKRKKGEMGRSGGKRKKGRKKGKMREIREGGRFREEAADKEVTKEPILSFSWLDQMFSSSFIINQSWYKSITTEDNNKNVFNWVVSLWLSIVIQDLAWINECTRYRGVE